MRVEACEKVEDERRSLWESSDSSCSVVRKVMLEVAWLDLIAESSETAVLTQLYVSEEAHGRMVLFRWPHR